MANQQLSTNGPTLDDRDLVESIVKEYLYSLHHADVSRLENIFHPDAYLKAPGLRRNLGEWLELVAKREVPARRGDAEEYKILSMDVMHEQAMVKVRCPLLDRVYIDFLGLLKENGRWLIVNKMYADQ